MSFLFKKRKIFLFILLFVIFLAQPNNLKAEDMGGGIYGSMIGDNIDKANEARAVLTNPESTESEKSSAQATINNVEAGNNPNGTSMSGLGDTAMRIMEGLVAAAIPFAALFSLPFGMIAFALSSLVLGMASYGVDLALEIGVNLMSQIVHNDANSVKTSWQIFRNIGNVGIIFATIYIAIKTVLRASGYDGKVLLGRVVVAGLLINFSFFFGALVVDVSNIMSLEIYKKVAEITGDGEKVKLGEFMFNRTSPGMFQSAITKDAEPVTREFFETTFKNQSEGGGNAITNFLRSATLFTVNFSLGYILGTVANLALAVVIFMAIFMIYSRLIIILLLLVISPLAFVGMILPNTQKMSKEWWDSLIGQSFFLPAFLLFLLVSLKLIENLPDLNNSVVGTQDQLQLTGLASYAKIFTPQIFNYLMVIGFFVAALMAAKKVSSMGSAAINKISSSITATTGGAAAAGLAFAGRNTIGAGANAMASRFAKTDFAQTRTGMVLLDSMKGVAKNSFDARESIAFKGVASATGVGGDFKNTLAPQKGGYIDQQKRAEERRVKLAGNLSNDLTQIQKDEAKQRSTTMENMVDNDGNVVTKDQAVRTADAALKAAKRSGNVATIQSAQTTLQTAKREAEEARELVKTSAAYKAEKEALDAIVSARGAYAKSLEGDPGKISTIRTLGTTWLPGSRSADKSAAKKIMAQKSESEKLLEGLKKAMENSGK